MEQLSALRLQPLYPPFVKAIMAADSMLAEEGIYIRVVSALRTAQDQDALYAQGRTTPGKIVTNARAGYSMHNYGLAVDVVPFLVGQSGPLNWGTTSPQYKQMVNALKYQGLQWGGDWEGSLGDYDHFQVQGLAPTPTDAMRAMYGNGDADALQAIWANLPNFISTSTTEG